MQFRAMDSSEKPASRNIELQMAHTEATDPVGAERPCDECQLGALGLDKYSLVIDARSPHEYAEDHIPGAINLPVVDDDQFAEVGKAYRVNPHNAYVVGAQYALRNIADHVERLIRSYPADARFLVYCFRGGKRSRAWAEPLRAIGYQTDVLQGGWKAYRRAVLAALGTLPLQFEFRVVAGMTGSGKTRLLRALRVIGQQVIDLEALAVHKGSLLGLMPGDRQPTQKLFDSELVRLLSSLDKTRPVWVEAESKKVGRLQLPDALLQAMNGGKRFELLVPLAERVRLLREEYPHLADEPMQIVEQLAPLKPLVGAKELDNWKLLARHRQIDELVTRLLTTHYDPSYARSRYRQHVEGWNVVEVNLPDLTDAAIARSAEDLAAR